jgi:hypothetical protein
MDTPNKGYVVRIEQVRELKPTVAPRRGASRTPRDVKGSVGSYCQLTVRRGVFANIIRGAGEVNSVVHERVCRDSPTFRLAGAEGVGGCRCINRIHAEVPAELEGIGIIGAARP